jgi:uncharacterized membrane protein
MRKHLSETTGPQRLAYGLGAGLATLLLPLPASWPESWPARGLLAWCAGATVYLVLAWWLCHSFDADETRQRAQAQDEPGIIIFFLLLGANLACVTAITLMMQDIGELAGARRGVLIGLLISALALSWLFIQTIFTFHYARRYYQAEKRRSAEGPGLAFPGGREPDYFDFLYYSHVVGMTSQVSDVQVTSRAMRRLTLVHSVLAFGFNMLIFALSINVVAGMLK